MMLTVNDLPNNAPPTPQTAKIPLHRLADALTAHYDRDPELDGVVRPDQRLDVICGEPVMLTFGADCTRRWDIVRAPALPRSAPPKSMAATLEGGRLIASVPGRYVVRLTLVDSGFTRDIELVALPPESLGAVGLRENQAVERRRRVRAIVRDARVTPETITTALESGEKFQGGDTLARLVGMPEGAPFNPHNYG